MSFLNKIFHKSKNTYKISQTEEKDLVVFLRTKKNVKLNSKILVPDGFCAILFSREKLLDEVPKGEHELNGFTIEKTCKINKLDKPTKKGYRKEMKLDFYFVSLKDESIQNSFYIKKLKQNINFSLDFKITNPYQFLKFLISDRVVFDNKFARSHFKFCTSQLLYYYFLDNKIITNEKLENFLTKKLNNIGVEILDFELGIDTIKNNSHEELDVKIKQNNEENIVKTQIFDEKTKNFEINTSLDKNEIKENNLLNTQILNNTEYNKTKNFGINTFDGNTNLENGEIKNTQKINEKNPNKVEYDLNDTYKKSLINLDDIKSESVSYFVCSKCGAKLPASSKECYYCHTKIEEKNYCENCGKEIEKGLFVCPHCKSVIINN